MKQLLCFLLIAISFGSCTKLNVDPRGIEDLEQFFANEDAYTAFLARIYAGLAVTGQQGPDGNPDLQNTDEGFSSYLRQYWQLQELTTDEAIIGWSDEGLPDLHYQNWTSNNQFIRTMYSRIFYQVALVNDFLSNTTTEKLAERNVSEATRLLIPTYRAEARLLRALSYWHGMDLFGRLPLYTEQTVLSNTPPPQLSRAALFAFIEEELHEIKDLLPLPGNQEYGRFDQAVVWALQARLFLNAEIYTGRIRYDECIQACLRIIESGQYTLEADYHHLFTTDNHTSKEIIFAIPFDGMRTQTWGGMTYLVHAALGGTMNAEDYGVRGAWSGLRTTSAFVHLAQNQPFNELRTRFYTDGQSLEIERINDFQHGYALPKFTNLSKEGISGSNETFPDTDFPLFRLGEIYLTYAEAVLRGGAGGDRAAALTYLNALRTRAGAGLENQLTDTQLTLNYLLDERARELYWEGHRRTDLIRFNRFTNNGIWPWKGGVRQGIETPVYRNLFPIPEAELLANPALEQNSGY